MSGQSGSRVPDSPDGPAGADGRGDVAYMLPRHHTEIDRLDVQHYALQVALSGNYLAPVQGPRTVLDVGCGTGQWAFDLCAQFPDAEVVGFDLEPSKPDAPRNYRFVQGNLLEGLPFEDNGFDLVHQRLLVTGLPLNAWPDVVADLVRVARPGAWIELVEAGADIEPSGPATRRLFELTTRLAASFDLDTSGVVVRSLDDYLRLAGAERVSRRSIAVPIGEWGGRVGSLMASDFRSMFTRLGGTLRSQLRLAREECDDLVSRMQQEWERYRTRYTFTYAFGRKPD